METSQDSQQTPEEDSPNEPLSPENLKDSRKAWIVCFSSFILQICVLGILHAFGVFFVAFLTEFNCSKAAAAWVGSGCYGLTMAVAPISSIVIKKFGHRVSAASGCLICAVSMVISSFMTSINALYGSFTVLFAIGCSLAYTPCMTIATDYFDKYASQAVGIMTAGSSTGTLIISPVSQGLVNAIGWRNTFRCLAGGCVVGFLCALQFSPLAPREKTPVERIKTSLARKIMKELHLWKNKVYVIWIAAVFCVMFGYYIPYVHLISHATEIGISPSLGAVLIMTLGGTCALGRVIWGKVLQKGYLDRLRLDQMSMVITGTFVMILPLFKTFPGLMLYVIVIGLVDGCYVVLLPTLTEAFTGNENKVIAWGFLNLICSVSFTMGPVVAGWIYDATGSYNISFHVAGVPIILGAVIMFFIPWAQRTARSTNAMTAARQSYDVMSDSEEEQGTGEFIEMSNAITIPRSHHGSYERSPPTLPFGSKGSFVVVDLSHNVVQAFSTSKNKHVPITDDEKLPDALAQAMFVLHKKSESIMSLRSREGSMYGHSYNASSTDRYPFSTTPRLSYSQRANTAAIQNISGSQGGVSSVDSQGGTGSLGVQNTMSAQGTLQQQLNMLNYERLRKASSPSSTAPTSPPYGSGTLSPEDLVTSPVGSPPQDMFSSIFQQISSNPSLPPIAELPSTMTATIVDTEENRGNAVRRRTSSEQQSGSQPNSPGENHAMYQISDFTELSLSNLEINDDNIDGDK